MLKKTQLLNLKSITTLNSKLMIKRADYQLTNITHTMTKFNHGQY